MIYDRRHDFVNIFVLWIGLHILGGGFGILLGEIIGQLIAAVLSSALGHFAAFVVFEAVLWLSRRMVFRSIPFDPMWKLVTQTLWMFTEVLGWAIGTQAALISPTPRFTEGAVFGATIGAAMWFLLWCARLARPGRWWVSVATLYATGGLMIGLTVVTLVLVLSDEIRTALVAFMPAALAAALAGALMGLGIGALTGVVVAFQIAFGRASSYT
jgi:hypothetical protein